MAGRSEPPEDLRWLLEPPGHGQVHVHVAIGEGAQLTPGLQEAIELLLTRLHEADRGSDVSGFCRLISCDALWRLGGRGGTCNICRKSGG